MASFPTALIKTVALAALAAAALWHAPVQAQEQPPERGVLSLEAALRTALAQHPDIKQGQSLVDQSAAVVNREQSAYWPQIDGDLAYQRVKRGFVGGVTGRAVVNLFSQYTAGVRGSQRLFDFGRTWNRVAAARGRLESQRFGLVSVVGDVALNVKVAYLQTLATQRLLAVSEASLKRLSEHLRQAEGLYEVGLRPKIDVTRARVDLATGEADRVRRAADVQVAKATLANAVGVVLPPEVEVAQVPVGELPAAFEPLLAEALRQRPEVRQVEAAQKGLEAQVSAAWAEYLPQLDGEANYNYTGSQFPLVNNWDIGASLSVPLFDGFLTRANVSEARALLRQNQAQFEALRQDVRLEVERSFLDVRAAQERLVAQSSAVVAAKENLELAQARYREGLGSAVEFTDAEVSLTEAEAAEVQALYELQINQATLARAVGGPQMLAAPGGAAVASLQ